MKWQNGMPFVHFSLEFGFCRMLLGCFDLSAVPTMVAYLNRRETNVHLCKCGNYVRRTQTHTNTQFKYIHTRCSMLREFG